MARNFALTVQAQDDLFEIWDYIAEDSLDNADKVRDEFFGALQMLANNPGIGHYREELADKRHRFWPIYSYVIVYRECTDPLQIIAIIHGARDLRTFLNTSDRET